jgi:hypothetical protein
MDSSSTNTLSINDKFFTQLRKIFSVQYVQSVYRTITYSQTLTNELNDFDNSPYSFQLAIGSFIGYTDNLNQNITINMPSDTTAAVLVGALSHELGHYEDNDVKNLTTDYSKRRMGATHLFPRLNPTVTIQKTQ